MDELKPCPFCGGEGQISPDGEVYCKDCGCSPEPFENDPVENWNNRVEIVDKRIFSEIQLMISTCAYFGDVSYRMGSLHAYESMLELCKKIENSRRR